MPHPLMRCILLAVAAPVCLVLPCPSFGAAGSAAVTVYPVPDAVSDSPYGVAVDGKVVPIERAGAFSGAYYARFQFSKPVRATVTVTGPGRAEFVLKPECFREDLSVDSRSCSFTVSEPGPRVFVVDLAGKGLWPLIVIAERPEIGAPRPSDYSVIDVRGYVGASGGVQTSGIQKALDECALRPGGGVVYFPPGIYETGTLRIGNNTTVYLAPGALVRGSTDPSDYPVDPGRIEQGTHGPVCSNSRLIIFDHCVNSSIRGYGVIDGMGHVVRNKHKRHVQLVDVTGSKSIRMENVVLRNSAEWTLHILGCDRVFVDDLKIINDHGVSNTDGIDPDGSRDVYVNRYFGFCGDDAVAIKTTGNSDLLRSARNIKFRDCVVMTRKTSYKIGTETYADIDSVLFERCEAINSSRGIGLWECDGHAISNVVFRDVKLDLMEIPGESMSGEPFRAIIEGRHGFGKIRGIAFERVQCSSPYRSILAGVPESALEDFSFRDCVFTVKPREVKMGKLPLFSTSHVRGFVFENSRVHWSTTDPDNWDCLFGPSVPEGISARGLQETR